MRCKVCGQPSGDNSYCQHCLVTLVAAKSSFVRLDTCQTCRHGIGGIGPRGSTDRACDLSDEWVVPSNGYCNQHTR